MVEEFVIPRRGIGLRGHSDPMDVDAVNFFSPGKGKGSSSPRDGCCKCGGAHFQRDCNVWQGKTEQVIVQVKIEDAPRLLKIP